MKPTECRINHQSPLTSNMQQDQTPIRVKLVHPQRMLCRMTPRSMSQLVKVRIGSDEEQLLIDFVVVVGCGCCGGSIAR